MKKYNTFVTYATNDKGEDITEDNKLIWHKYKKGSRKEYVSVSKRAQDGDIPQLNEPNSRTVSYYTRNIPKFGEERTEFIIFES